jgi:hypothetical protein
MNRSTRPLPAVAKYLALTVIVAAGVLSIVASSGGGRITAVPSNTKSNLNLTFYSKAPLDAITPPTPHNLAWNGSRFEGPTATGDTLPPQTDQVTTNTASWQSNQVSIANVNPGSWSISVTVDGLTWTCPVTDVDAAGQGGPINLAAGKTNWVSVQFDQAANSVYCDSASA